MLSKKPKNIDPIPPLLCPRVIVEEIKEVRAASAGIVHAVETRPVLHDTVYWALARWGHETRAVLHDTVYWALARWGHETRPVLHGTVYGGMRPGQCSVFFPGIYSHRE